MTRIKHKPEKRAVARFANPVPNLVAVAGSVTVLVAALAPAPAQAELLFQDSFGGSNGLALATYDADYVISRSGEPSPTVIAELKSPGLTHHRLAATGNAVQIGLANAGYLRQETVLWTNDADCKDKKTAGPLYFSFLVRVAESNDLTEGSFVGLQIPYSPSRLLNVGIQNHKGALKINCWRVGSGAPEGLDYKAGETVLVVGKIPAIADSGYQLPVVSLYLNPDIASEPEKPTATIPTYNAKDEQVNLTAVSLVAIRAGKAQARATGILDEVRLGTTWADVVPAAKN